MKELTSFLVKVSKTDLGDYYGCIEPSDLDAYGSTAQDVLRALALLLDKEYEMSEGMARKLMQVRPYERSENFDKAFLNAQLLDLVTKIDKLEERVKALEVPAGNAD